MKKLMIGILFAFAIIFSGAAYAAAPLITNSTPADGAFAIKTNSNVTVTVNDTDGNLMNITFSMWNGTTWRTMSTFTNRPNGRYTGNGNGFFTKPYTEYMWRAIVTDSTGESTTLISNFTTGDLLKQKWMVDIGTLTDERQIWPVIGDIDNDGTNEVVFAAKNSVYSINSKTGAIEWTVVGGGKNSVELVDLNNDGTPEVLVALSGLPSPRVRAINGDGSIRWTSEPLSGEDVPMFPLIAYDTDGDGYPEIYFATEDPWPEPYTGNASEYTGALHMLDYNGNLLRSTHLVKSCWGGISLGDTDYDGRFEIYVSDRRDGYVNIPSEGLRAYYADTLEPIWSRPDLQHSSPLAIIEDVYSGGDLEVIAQPITLRGPIVLHAKNGSSIKDYQNKGLPTHAAATAYDIDGDGNIELMMGTSYPSSAPRDLAIFDLVTGQTDFRPNLSTHMTWAPNVGSVTPDGKMQILAAMGEQMWESNYPILIFDSNFNLIDQVTITGGGQLTPAKVYDIDGDGLNEVVVAGVRGRIFAYDTLAPTKYPQPRAGTQLYSEFRRGAAEFVDYPGPKEPFVMSTSPVDGALNVSANPKLTIRAVDFQKDKFNVSFQIYHGFQWKTLATYNNVNNGNFTANTTPFVTDPSTEYKWRVILTDVKGNSKTYEYSFMTIDNITTSKPIVEAISPADYEGAFTLSALVFNISDNSSMTYNVTTFPNVGSAYASGVPSGQYSVPLAGLMNNQEYIWRVEVSDGSSITYKEYHFSTPWDLNITINGNGVVSTNPLPPFAHNGEVNLTATPNPGNTFLGWIGDYVSYNNPLTIVMDNPKSVTARFRTDSGTAIADGMFDDSLSQQELVDDAPYQDWYESRNNGDYRYLLTLDENNVGGNSGKKAKLNGSLSGNAYLTQDFKTPFNETFKLQWQVYVDSILNSSSYPDRAAIMMVGDNNPYNSRGPNYQAVRNFVWLGFYKDGGAETGTADLVTALNNASEIVLASGVPLDTWHTIRVEGSLITDTYDVYLNDVLVGSGITARTNKTNVTHITFAQWNDGAGTFYIDNVMEVTGPIVCVDGDSDGYNVTGFTCGPVDCNDADPSINPGATEVCDGIDNNCVGGIDEGLTTTYYADADSDLFGNPLVSQNACSMPSGYVADNNDCDDTDAGVNPSATEVCNGIDDNCDGNIDEGDVCGGGAGTLDGWAYRKMITIDQVSDNLVDFPVLIKLDDSDLLKAQADGDDIAFTTSDGLTKLSHEIESYDSGALVAWVKTDLSSSADTIIYMYYGNPAASNQEDAENVWDNNYLAVHHLEEKIGDAIDSTSNDNDGTADNGINQDASGFIDNGYALDGVNDKVTMPRVFTSESQFTIEGWVNTGSKQGYVVSQRGTNGVFIQYYSPENNFQMFVNSMSIKAPASANDWHYVVGTYDGTTARLYVDAGTPVSGTATLSWPDLQTLIGDRSTGARAFLGSLDEIRLSDTARSAGYIEASYDNQLNPSGFYSVGSEEELEACSDGETLQCGTTDVGACSYGLMTCSSGVWGSCVGNIEPIVEICENGIDDDCDGVADEGCAGYGDWDHRKAITVDTVDADLNGFPLLISIDDSDLAASAQADGDDIFFTAADGLTKLSHEIESYDSGALVAWVKTDLSSSADTIIYMYYGNPAATNQEDAENVWDNDYLTVQHKDAIDSNGNNDGTLLNGVAVVDAKISEGLSFDGVDDRVTMSQLFSSQDEFTFEAWVNTASKQGYVISQRDGSGNGAFLQYYPPEGNFQLYVNSLSIKAPASANDWHYVVGTYDGTTARLYVDAGTPVSGDTGLIWPSLGTLIGDRTALGRAFQGSVDEIRISEVARSDSYISASYENQNDPNGFYTVGSQE